MERVAGSMVASHQQGMVQVGSALQAAAHALQSGDKRRFDEEVVLQAIDLIIGSVHNNG